ncbi:MAG: ABC transporter ATP-binding protein [Candidatus Omnitrophica bacterium]|nr:ABC transporter ATP-binding protein [Candidatus Omnitrophota bacterium]
MENKKIQIENVTFIYPNGVKALDDISFDIFSNRGKIVGFLGPNGAGKTTLLNILTTTFRFFKGRVLINELDTKKDYYKIREIISVAPQELIVDALLSVEDNLYIYGKLAKVKNLSDKIEKLLNFFDLNDKRKEQVLYLSGGQQRRVQICRALLKEDAEIFFIDEPTIELDPVGKSKVWDKLVELKNDGKLVILATNDMDDVENLCDEVVFINKGKIIFQGETRELKERYKNDEKIIIKTFTEVSFEKLKNIKNDLRDIQIETNSSYEHIIYTRKGKEFIPKVMEIFLRNNIKIKEVDIVLPTLNEIFNIIVKKNE